MNLLLLSYNNYFNRIIKKEDNYQDYITASGNKYAWKLNIDFDPKDGVDASQIINWDLDFTPDYIVCCEGNNYTIKSRWFIQEWSRVRGKQYNAVLRRDVIADNLETVKNAPTYIEKATILDPSNQLIYNSEGLQVNQIKKDETLLKDKSGCPWLVAYLAKGTIDDINGKTVDVVSNEASITITTPIEQWEYYQYVANPFKVAEACRWDTYFRRVPGATRSTHSIYIHSEDVGRWVSLSNWKTQSSFVKDITDYRPLLQQYEQFGFNSLLNETIHTYGYHTLIDYSAFSNLNGKTIKDSNGKYYDIKVITVSSEDQALGYIDSTHSNLRNIMTQLFNTAYDLEQEPNEYSFGLTLKQCKLANIVLTERQDLNAAFSFTASDKKGSSDPLYDIICVPYGELLCYTTTTSTGSFTSNETISMGVMNSLVEQLGKSNVLDLQLVPYCPIQEALYESATGVVSIQPYLLNPQHSTSRTLPIVKDGTTLYAAYIVPSGNFTFDINKRLELERPHEIENVRENLTFNQTRSTSVLGNILLSVEIPDEYMNNIEIVNIDTICNGVHATGFTFERWEINSEHNRYVFYANYPNTTYITAPVNIEINVTLDCDEPKYTYDFVSDIKVSNECDKYRLCSPNYNGLFEFSVAKNGANVSKFNVDCTYKPYSPYIHVNPDFSGLYGKDWDDARGLICGGDFSLGIIDNAWNEYEIQNKNYQNIFDRQIQNLDVNQKIQMKEAKWKVAGGAASGAAGGAVAGSVGGPIGAAAGAVIGGVTSTIGGIADIKNLETVQREQRDYMLDNYNYSLQNIQALPLGITRTSAITRNNKLFPFVEYYTCTDVEKEALRNKMIYDGMSIGVIDTINNWLEEGKTHYIKGQIIRLDGLDDESHMASIIYDEIYKGVYL